MSLWSRPLTTVCLLVGEYVYPCLIHRESVSFSREQWCWPPRRAVRLRERWELQRWQSKALLPKLTLFWLLPKFQMAGADEWRWECKNKGIGGCGGVRGGSWGVHISVCRDARGWNLQPRHQFFIFTGAKMWSLQVSAHHPLMRFMYSALERNCCSALRCGQHQLRARQSAGSRELEIHP